MQLSLSPGLSLELNMNLEAADSTAAFCSPAKGLTFSGFMENPLVGKRLKSQHPSNMHQSIGKGLIWVCHGVSFIEGTPCCLKGKPKGGVQLKPQKGHLWIPRNTLLLDLRLCQAQVQDLRLRCARAIQRPRRAQQHHGSPQHVGSPQPTSPFCSSFLKTYLPAKNLAQPKTYLPHPIFDLGIHPETRGAQSNEPSVSFWYPFFFC